MAAPIAASSPLAQTDSSLIVVISNITPLAKMKARNSAPPPTRLAWMLIGGAVCLFAVTPPVSSAPPIKRQGERVAQDVGSFFFRVARKLEQPVPNPERVTVRVRTTRTESVEADPDIERASRPQLGTNNPASRVWDPTTQQWLPAGMVTQRNAYRSVSGVTVQSSRPAMPSIRLQPRPGGSSPVITDADITLARQQEGTRYLDPYGPEATEAYIAAHRRDEPAVPEMNESKAPSPAPSTTAAPVKPATPQTPAEYGTRVPGKPGFVYPPGVEQDTKNMLDVRGLAAGQKVRDPRDGKIFLVP